MKKCALIIGHKKSSPGAVNESSGITEFEFNDKLATDIEAAVDDVTIQRIYRRTYQTLPDDINVYTPDFIISMHCNAFNKSASGSEVLYYHKSSKGKAMAEILQANLVNALGLKDRGIKPRTVEDRGGHLLKYTHAPCVIAEPFFIDNDNDFDLVNGKRDELIDAYARSISEIAGNQRRENMTESYIIPDDTNDIGIVTSGDKAKLVIIGPTKQQTFNYAKDVADVSPTTRKVVWIKDPQKATNWTGGDDTIVVVPLSSNNQIARDPNNPDQLYVIRDESTSRFDLDAAFAVAETSS